MPVSDCVRAWQTLVGETSTRVRGSSVGRVCVGGSRSRENTKRDGENDYEVQPEDDKRSGVGRVGPVNWGGGR